MVLDCQAIRLWGLRCKDYIVLSDGDTSLWESGIQGYILGLKCLSMNHVLKSHGLKLWSAAHDGIGGDGNLRKEGLVRGS